MPSAKRSFLKSVYNIVLERKNKKREVTKSHQSHSTKVHLVVSFGALHHRDNFPLCPFFDVALFVIETAVGEVEWKLLET